MTYLFKIIVSIAALTMLVSTSLAGEARQVKTVVELYTSQGCSSCPPADRIMGDLVKDPEVLGLSFAVTYWDYIGWKDVFGSPDNDDRQTRYRDRLNARYVYTPQMVIAGQDHFVGSNTGQLKYKLREFRGHAEQIPLSWHFEGSELKIKLPKSKADAVIWQVDFDYRQPVKIRRGENTGKTITYHNVVRKTQNLTTWQGQEKMVSLDLDDLKQEGRDGCAILIQEQGYGQIIAAIVVDL